MKNDGTFYKLNWDNDFSVRFNFKSDTSLIHIPNNIFSVELPAVSIDDAADNELHSTFKLTLRSTVDGQVENELFNTLFGSTFDIDVSLSNKNKVNWRYLGCTVDNVNFSPLIDRKSKSNPFNYTVNINVSQIVYNGDEQIIKFGKDIIDFDEVQNNTAKIKETSPELIDLTKNFKVDKGE